MSSRDNESAIADTIKKIAVDLGTTSVDVSEWDPLERVAESKSNLSIVSDQKIVNQGDRNLQRPVPSEDS